VLTSPGGRLFRFPLLPSPPVLVPSSSLLFEDEDDAGRSDEEGAMSRRWDFFEVIERSWRPPTFSFTFQPQDSRLNLVLREAEFQDRREGGKTAKALYEGGAQTHL
jgi:hypothetical protein